LATPTGEIVIRTLAAELGQGRQNGELEKPRQLTNWKNPDN
jgi:hypothetical protein